MAGANLTVEELSSALRLGDSPEERQEAERLLSYSGEAALRYAPEAPEIVLNESCIRAERLPVRSTERWPGPCLRECA